MELKVWVDGVVRVVCGLSEETSCQDVVIALAQAIGQTGRYVLIQRLRDTERQLLANEKPLESLAKLGQHGSEVQFFLRRTGPSSSDVPGPDRGLPLPKLPEPEHLKRREPKKSLTFNLGPSSSPRAKSKQPRKTPRDSPDQKVPHASNGLSSLAGPTKQEVFRHVLQQQERLAALEAQMEALERESQAWEQPLPTSGPGLQDELDALEQAVRRNQAELIHEDYWEEELRVETEREGSMRRKLGELHAKMDDCGRRLHEFSTRSAQLELEIQRESKGSKAPSSQTGLEKSVDSVQAELQSQQRQGAELQAELSETEKAMGKAESLLEAKQEELEELNKELRQCNLQHFIQQTGTLPGHSSSRTDLTEQLEHVDLAQLLQERYKDSSPLSGPADSPPRPTAKQFLGHPRNLQHPLVSRLNPEVLTSRESSWR
uniref:Ras-associating domain-containing protein n=1 Tax=Denticeps clupeoides TaxID=299321 RepID=A0AAY4D0C1_9TELE